MARDCSDIERTLFILDCSPSYRSTSCGEQFEVDKHKQTVAITKSLYTCLVEAVHEYSRIVWDLFPNGQRLLRFVCSEPSKTHAVSGWALEEQNYDKLVDNFAAVKQYFSANKTESSSVEHLLSSFDQAMASFKTESQKNGRIIIASHLENEKQFKELKKALQSHFDSELGKSCLKKLYVIILNTFPIGSKLKNDDVAKSPVNGLMIDIHPIWSGRYLYGKLIYLAFDHYDLTSTTVSGIPMKEEQNAGSSANYDVEIVHSKKAHTQFFDSSDFRQDFDSFFTNNTLEGQKYRTLILKWCTPKNGNPEIGHCNGAYRFTAVNVTSRPSSCLINFLYTGKTVNLEMPRIKNTKLISHMLQTHNGELFIHSLRCNKTLFDNPPSIIEAVGGSVPDYRVKEFVEFMKKNRLFQSDGTSSPVANRMLLAKQTQYWPPTYGLTVMLNGDEQLKHFYNLIQQDVLSSEEVLHLQQIIFQTVKNDASGLKMPLQNALMRDNIKKEDYYRILWNEMEHSILCSKGTSQHLAVLQCLLDCVPMQNRGNREHALMANTRKPLARPSEESISSINSLAKSIKPGTCSLHQLYVRDVVEKNASKRCEFRGRLNGNPKKFKLYADMNEARGEDANRGMEFEP